MVKILLYLLLFFLPTQLGRHFWFDFSYKLGQRIDYLAPTVYVTDILVFLVIVVFLIIQNSSFDKLKMMLSKVEASKFKIQNDNAKLKISSFHYFIVSLLILSVGYWLLIIRENPYLLAYNLIKLGEFVLLGWVIAKTFTRKDLPQIVKILNLALILQVSLAVYQVIVEKSAGLWIIGEREFSISSIGIAKFLAPNGHLLLRGYGTFPHPNVLGGFCLLMLTANVWLFLSVKGRTLRRWQGPTLNNAFGFLLGFIFSLIGIWLSMSTVAIVLSQAFLAGLVFKHLKLLKFLRSKIMIIFSFSLFILIFAFCILHFTRNNESIFRRLALLAAASEEFLASPIFGIGLGNFIPAMKEEPLLGRTYFWQPAHNVGALVLAETGLAGVAIVLLLIWRGIKKSKVKSQKSKVQVKIKKFENNILNTQYSFLITSWWLIILVTGLFDHYWLTLQQGRLLLCLVAGLTFIKENKS